MERIITKEELAEATDYGPFCCVYRLADNKTIVKSGTTTRLAEAKAMRFVRDHTSIPVPEVYNAYWDEESGRVRIVMEYIEGERLDHAWDKLTKEEKESSFARSAALIGSVDGSACDDVYFENEPGAYGPYSDEDAFNHGIIQAWTTGHDDPWISNLCEMFRTTMKDHRIVTTHNDYYPRNILVRGSEVVAVLD